MEQAEIKSKTEAERFGTGVTMQFVKDGGALVCRHAGETLRIEAWGQDAFRVRASMAARFTGNDWALTEKIDSSNAQITIAEEDHWVGDGTIDKRPIATIVNGRLKAVVNFAGVLSFYRDDALILREIGRAHV